MKRHYKIVVYTIITVLVIAIAGTTIVRFNLLPRNKQNNMWQQSKASSSQNSETNHPSKTLYHVGDEVSTNGDIYDFTYKITKITVSKEKNIINFPMREVWNEVAIDEKGNITNDYSYVLVQATITNPKDQEQELYLNSNYLDIKDKNGIEKESVEPFAMNQNTKNVGKKNAMQYIFKPKESTTFELVYIIKDMYLEDSYTMVFIITNESAMVYNPKTEMDEYGDEVRYIQIRQEDIDKK